MKVARFSSSSVPMFPFVENEDEEKDDEEELRIAESGTSDLTNPPDARFV